MTSKASAMSDLLVRRSDDVFVRSRRHPCAAANFLAEIRTTQVFATKSAEGKETDPPGDDGNKPRRRMKRFRGGQQQGPHGNEKQQQAEQKPEQIIVESMLEESAEEGAGGEGDGDAAGQLEVAGGDVALREVFPGAGQRHRNAQDSERNAGCLARIELEHTR